MEVKYGLHPTLGEHGERELPTLQKVDYLKGDVKVQVLCIIPAYSKI